MHIHIYWCEQEIKTRKFTLTGHLRRRPFCLRGTYGKQCQNFDGWTLTYGSTCGLLTDAYGTAVRAALAKRHFTTTYGITYVTLTGAYGTAV